MTPKFNNKFEFAMAKLITHTHTHKRSYPESRKTCTLFTICLEKQEHLKAFNIKKRRKYLFFLCVHVVGYHNHLRLVKHLDVLCAHIDNHLDPLCVVGHPSFLCVCVANCPNPLHVNGHPKFFHFANSMDPLCLVDHPNVLLCSCCFHHGLFHVWVDCLYRIMLFVLTLSPPKIVHLK